MSENFDDPREELTPGERDFAAALAALRPSGVVEGGAAFRDRLMFQAGRTVGERNAAVADRRQLWAWRGAAAGFALVACVLAIRIAGQSRDAERQLYVRGQGPTAIVETPATQESPAIVPQRRDRTVNGITRQEPARPQLAAWEGVRGDYLTTRAAVLRWGVAALPAPVDHAPVQRPASMSAHGMAGPDADDGPRATPERQPSSFEPFKQWFFHSSERGPL